MVTVAVKEHSSQLSAWIASLRKGDTVCVMHTGQVHGLSRLPVQEVSEEGIKVGGVTFSRTGKMEGKGFRLFSCVLVPPYYLS